MAKKRKAAKRRVTRKAAKAPAQRRHVKGDDSTINTLIILGVIVIALAVMYFYVQNKKQAAMLPNFGPVLAAFIGPQHATAVPAPPATVLQTVQPAAGAETAQPATAQAK